MLSLKNYFRKLNLFEPVDNNGEIEDAHRHRSNIISTRVYLIVLTLVLIVAGLFLWLSSEANIHTLDHPTQDQFEASPADAECLCSRISISHDAFTSFQSSFHQICSSDFVSDRWIRSIFSGSNSTYFYTNDFRTYGSAQFQALTHFCQLSQANVAQNNAIFGLSTLLSPRVLSETILRSKTQASIDQFQSTAFDVFRAQLELVRQMIKNNRLVSGLETNVLLLYYIDNNNEAQIRINRLIYPHQDDSLCGCSDTIDCEVPSGIYNDFGAPIQFILSHDKQMLMYIRGISTGCLPADTILLSTLDCFYNQRCVDKLISFFPTTERFTAMTLDKQSRFNRNSTVRMMFDSFMVEYWRAQISYSKYYDQCAPYSCTYLKVERNGFIFSLTTLIGLLGGLTLVLELIIPNVIRFIKRRRNREPAAHIPRK